MCERVWRNAQDCVKKQGLATGSCGWISQVAHGLQAARSCMCAKHAKKLNRHVSCSTTRQKVQFSCSVTSQLELVAQSSREAKPPASSVLEKLTLRIPNTHKYKYPLYPRNVESFQREYWERNPREKQDWLIYNLYIETLQISLLSPSPLLHIREVFDQIFFSPYPHLWEGFLVLWKAIRKGPISYWLMLWFIVFDQIFFSPYPHLWEGFLVLWKAIRKGPISYWLMLWLIVESGKLKKKLVQCNLVAVGA